MERLIDGYLALVSRHPDAPPLVFAGRVETPVARQTDPAKVRFLGYVSEEERLRLFRDASMLVIASWDEGFGLPALEAMTIGLPVIAANRGSLPEVLGASGILVDPDDPAEIADAMQRLLDDPALRREQAAKGVARASDFSWETSAARLAGAFQEALLRARGSE